MGGRSLQAKRVASCHRRWRKKRIVNIEMMKLFGMASEIETRLEEQCINAASTIREKRD